MVTYSSCLALLYFADDPARARSRPTSRAIRGAPTLYLELLGHPGVGLLGTRERILRTSREHDRARHHRRRQARGDRRTQSARTLRLERTRHSRRRTSRLTAECGRHRDLRRVRRLRDRVVRRSDRRARRGGREPAPSLPDRTGTSQSRHGAYRRCARHSPDDHEAVCCRNEQAARHPGACALRRVRAVCAERAAASSSALSGPSALRALR